VKKLLSLLSAFFAATVCILPATLSAQDFPNKPIRLLVPFTPGGGTDFISRIVATALTETLKWPVIIDNRPGAAGNLAVAQAAQAAPDGYTIVMGQPDNMMVGPYLYPNVGYDTSKSFAPIVQVSETSNILVTNGAGSLVSVADLISKGKTESGLKWATSGNGSTGHLYGGLFQSAGSIKLLQVPYKGAAPALADVMGGHVDVAMMSVPSVIGLVKAGKLTPVAVTSSQRSAMLPNTPTLNEAGSKVIGTTNWLGLFAPSGTPPAIVDRLNAAVNRVLLLPEVRQKMSDGGATAVGGSVENFRAFVQSDYAKWGQIVKDSGVKLE
jgi:tripartite-type tricarboxylate transporter receptor subunit TctC